jgi:capsular exopolysaccharide synthesis family protein
MFNLTNERGLTTLLVGDDIRSDGVVHQTEQPSLAVLTSGALPPNPTELLGSRRMQMVIDHLEATYDVLIIDSAPVLAVADAAVLSSVVDATLLVVDGRVSRRRAVREGYEALRRVGGRVIGVVLNRPRTGSRDEYRDYFADYSSHDVVDRRAPETATPIQQ